VSCVFFDLHNAATRATAMAGTRFRVSCDALPFVSAIMYARKSYERLARGIFALRQQHEHSRHDDRRNESRRKQAGRSNSILSKRRS
jgi:hypothetical protein